jgi:hypothetical protein
MTSGIWKKIKKFRMKFQPRGLIKRSSLMMIKFRNYAIANWEISVVIFRISNYFPKA